MSFPPTTQQADAIAALVKGSRMLQLVAAAGAGKTSTLVLMAEAVAKPSLYLAFNKATADEGAARFPAYVECKTTHSKAYAAFGAHLRDKLSRPKGGYVNVAGTPSEIARYYKINSVVIDADTSLSPAFVGLLIKSTVTRFEQSADKEVGLQHVPTAELKEKLEHAPQAISYVKNLVLATAKRLWAERISPNTVVLATHDTYLKLFQLSKPVFHGVEVLYVDEFQDTTPCVMDIVMNQVPHMQIVMVGDARQAIYGWRGAVNAMELMKPACEVKMLTKSFRFGQAVADVATAILEGDMKIEGFEKLDSKVGATGTLIDITKPYTRLFRTNAALLEAAIEAVRAGTPIAIEIDTRDFVETLKSAVALYHGVMKDVKHDKVIPYQTWDEMVEETEGGKNPEVGRLVKAVQERKAEVWIDILQTFKNAAEPLVTFTTSHKAKGREWDQVRVESDFKSGFDENGKWVGLVTEEQNLLYVACTRGKKTLELNPVAREYVARFFGQGVSTSTPTTTM